MADNLGEAVLDLRTDDDAFTRGIDRAHSQAKRLGKVFDDVGRKAQRIGKQLSTFVTLPILAIGAASVKTASDVQEMQNLFAVTFGEAAANVEEWAKRTATALNRSRFDLMQTAADFAAFLKPLGVAPEAIAPMSKALTQLTTDIGSFRNMTDEEVFTRLFSGLAGETEAVRRLGIDIGQAAIEQELLRQGINKNATEATQAEKVMARYSLIMRQTADAQGDAARTAGSFENQSKSLGALIKDIRVEIGQQFLPAAVRMTQIIRDLGRRFLGLSDDTRSGIVAVTAFVATIGPAIFALGLLSRAVGFSIAGLAFVPKVLGVAARAVRIALISVQVATVGFLAFFSTVPGLIITSLAAIVGGFFIFKSTIIGFVKGLVIALKDELVAGFNNKVVRPFQEAMNAIVGFLPESVTEFLGLRPLDVSDIIESSFTDDMKRVISEAAESGKKEFESFRETASRAVDSVAAKFGEIKGAVADFIPDLELADFTLENIGSKFDGLLAQFARLNDANTDLGAAATAAGEAGTVAFDEFGESVRSSVEDNLTQALVATRKFGEAVRNVLLSVAEAFVRFRIVEPFVKRLPIPGFAEGGRPQPNRPSIVGERGPELFVPDRSGTILPSGELAAMGGFRQEINIPLAFPPQLEAFIRNVAGPAGRDAALQVDRARRGRF